MSSVPDCVKKDQLRDFFQAIQMLEAPDDVLNHVNRVFRLIGAEKLVGFPSGVKSFKIGMETSRLRRKPKFNLGCYGTRFIFHIHSLKFSQKAYFGEN